MKCPEKATSQRQEVDWWLPVPGVGFEMTLNGPDEHVLELDSGGGCRAQEIYYKSLNRALEMGGFYNIKAMPQ